MMHPYRVRSVVVVLALALIGCSATKQAAKREAKLLETYGTSNAPEDQYRLGLHYYVGKDVRRSLIRARMWLERAAKQGHGGAQYALGTLDETECGVDTPFVGEEQTQALRASALDLYRQAFQNGDARAAVRLGRAYFFGKGVRQDYEEAYAWAKRAQEGGAFGADTLLGMLTLAGVPRYDPQEAYRLFARAMENGDLNAYPWVAFLLQDDTFSKEFRREALSTLAKTLKRTRPRDPEISYLLYVLPQYYRIRTEKSFFVEPLFDATKRNYVPAMIALTEWFLKDDSGVFLAYQNSSRPSRLPRVTKTSYKSTSQLRTSQLSEVRALLEKAAGAPKSRQARTRLASLTFTQSPQYFPPGLANGVCEVAASGFVPAFLLCAQHLDSRKNAPADAVAWYERALPLSSEVTLTLARFYASGRGVSQDPSLAYGYFTLWKGRKADDQADLFLLLYSDEPPAPLTAVEKEQGLAAARQRYAQAKEALPPPYVLSLQENEDVLGEPASVYPKSMCSWPTLAQRMGLSLPDD